MQSIFHLLFSVVLLGSVFARLPSTYADTESKAAKIFQQLDKNSDGSISADEVPGDKSRFFDILLRTGDQNKDGKLTRSEFDSSLKQDRHNFAAENDRRNRSTPQMAERFLNRLDRNGDKKISKDELPEGFRERMEPLFQRLNTDEISIEQMKRMGSRFSAGTRRPEMNSEQRDERFFSFLDTNKDGKLTIDEAPERSRPMIQRLLDRSRKGTEGSITKAEFMETFAKLRSRQRPGREEQDRTGKGEEDRSMKRPEMPSRPEVRNAVRFYGRPFVPAFVKALDTNDDGELDQSELSQAASQLEKLDRNANGSLDLREMMGFPSRSDSRERSRMNRPRRHTTDRSSEDSRKQKANSEKAE